MQAARQRTRLSALALGLCLSGATAAASQTVVANVPGSNTVARSEALELQGDLLGAAALLEEALASAPSDGQLHWRIARDLLRHAEANPKLDDAERAAFYGRARDWAHGGRTLAPDCAECCLYEFAGTARLASVHGLAQAVGTVREAGRLLHECLANPPRHTDASGSEEAALYYGASVYFRLMPDSEWMGWATGQRSDAARAVGFARRAVAIEERPRYRLELGAALLCDGARRGDKRALAEGRRWLDDAAASGAGIDAERARALRGDTPQRGCTLSHDDPS